MTAAQFGTWDPSSPPDNYTWTAGANSTGDTINTVVDAGNHLLVWDDFSPVNSTLISITVPVQATAS